MAVSVLAGCAIDPAAIAPSTTSLDPGAQEQQPVDDGGSSDGGAPAEDADAPTTVATVPPTTVPPTTVPETEFRCVSLLKCQFAFLEGVDYSLLKLEFTDFSVARLAGAKFVRANLKQAIFIRSDLTGADFTGADLTSANLTGAVVTGANFTNAKFDSTIICSVDLATAIGVTDAQLAAVQKFRDKGARYCP
jgi:hypothetical protein